MTAFALRSSVLGIAAALTLGGAWAAGDVRVGLVLEPPMLDPTAGGGAAIDEVTYQNIFEGLTRIDEYGAVQPALATAWTISDDGLTYTFTLAGGVTYHDGTTFDAEDVKFSLDRINATDSGNAAKPLYEPIASVRVIDPLTVEVNLKRATGDLLFNLGRGDAVMVAPESAANNANHPIGTGPFMFTSWTRGSELTISKYPNYWGTPAQLDSATFVFISDTATAVNALLAMDVDGFNYVSPEALGPFRNNPNFKIQVGTTEGETILAINNGREPFDRLEVRQAIAHAIDRTAIIDAAGSGYGTPIGSHFAPHHPYYIDLTGTYLYDLAKARELLAQAGYPNGFDATMKLPPVGYARIAGQVLASQLGAIGIRVRQINVEFAQWLDEVYTKKDYDLSVISHVEPFDIGIYANPDYYFQYDNPEFQMLMETLGATAEEARRKELAQQAQRILAHDAVNGFLFELAQTKVWNAKLEGMWANAPIEGMVLGNVHWTE